MTHSPIHVSVDQIRLFTLMRNGISQPFDDPLSAVRSMIAIQAQYAASIPFAIHARCLGAPFSWTDHALTRKRQLVKTWCLRGTLHALAADDLPLMTGVFGERYHLAVERVMLRECHMDAVTWRRIESDVLKALANGPLDRAALHAAVPRLREVPWAGWGEDVKGLAYQGDLIMVGNKGPRPIFARRDQWLPGLHFRPRTPIKSVEELLLRYLATFGPATLTDFSHWAGLPSAVVRDIVARSTPLLEHIRVDGHPNPLLIRADDVEELAGPLPETPMVTLLPKFDALTLAWRDPSRILDGGDRNAVFRPAGQIEATVLLHGRAVATWRVNRGTTTVSFAVTPVRGIDARAKKQVDAAFEALGTWMGARSVDVGWQ